jgi:hypothetical protein
MAFPGSRKPTLRGRAIRCKSAFAQPLRCGLSATITNAMQSLKSDILALKLSVTIGIVRFGSTRTSDYR